MEPIHIDPTAPATVVISKHAHHVPSEIGGLHRIGTAPFVISDAIETVLKNSLVGNTHACAQEKVGLTGRQGDAGSVPPVRFKLHPKGIVLLRHRQEGIILAAVEVCQSGFLTVSHTCYFQPYRDYGRIAAHISLAEGIGCLEETFPICRRGIEPQITGTLSQRPLARIGDMVPHPLRMQRRFAEVIASLRQHRRITLNRFRQPPRHLPFLILYIDPYHGPIVHPRHRQQVRGTPASIVTCELPHPEPSSIGRIHISALAGDTQAVAARHLLHRKDLVFSRLAGPSGRSVGQGAIQMARAEDVSTLALPLMGKFDMLQIVVTVPLEYTVPLTGVIR